MKRFNDADIPETEEEVVREEPLFVSVSSVVGGPGISSSKRAEFYSTASTKSSTFDWVIMTVYQ